MTGILDPSAADSLIFKATINSATLPTIASTSTVPSGKTWVAHGVCKLVETAAYAIGTSASTTAGAAGTGVGSGSVGGTAGGVSGNTRTGSGAGAKCGMSCGRYCGVAS